MKWSSIYFLGYVLVIGGIIGGLWQAGVLEQIGATWTTIGLVIALGLGIMLAVARGGTKQTIDIERD
jgi:hypothetical protein